MMDDKNIINLVDHINKENAVKTFNPADLGYFKIEEDKIMIRRIYSFIVDIFTIMLFNTAINVSYAVFVKDFLYLLNKDQQFFMTSSLSTQVATFLIIYVSYFFYSQYVMDGKTLGKFVFKLTTVRDDFVFRFEDQNYTPTILQAWRRTIGYLGCYLSAGIFFLFSFMSEDKRGLPDYLSQTRTVSDEWLAGMRAFKAYDHNEVRINVASLDKAA